MSTNVVALKSGGAIAAIIPQTIEEVFRLAQGISNSGLAPKGMDKPEQIMVAIMTGLEIGLPPMFAISKIAVINGRPSIWGDAVPALLWSRGFKLREWIEGEGDSRVAYCEVTRPDGEKILRSFSVAKAKKAGLWGKAGPWTQHDERMLQMRARGFACRDGAADALSGLYLREELDDPMRDITPAKSTPLEIPDIPDIPDAPTEAEASQEIAEAIGKVEAEKFLIQLEENISLCSSAGELAEIADHNANMISRLPKVQRLKAAKMLSEAAE